MCFEQNETTKINMLPGFFRFYEVSYDTICYQNEK